METLSFNLALEDKESGLAVRQRVQVAVKKKEVATISGLSRNVTYQDLGLPTKLGEMITEYAYTPIDERMADEIPDDDKRHNIMK